MMAGIEFANKEFFWLLLLIPIIGVWYGFQYRKQFVEFKLPTLSAFANAKQPFKVYARHILWLLRLTSFILLLIALARPQSSLDEEKVTTEGIDIVMAIDVSSSMLAEDLKPNRLEAAKNVAIDFIKGRYNDRIGLVVFAGESFTQCPITTDHAILKNLFKDVKSGLLEDGTAIGMGLGTAVNRLKSSKAKSKVIILLTDGENNSGFIDPLTAADAAIQFGVRVYTIGVGTIGMAPYPVQTRFGKQYQNMEVKIDEPLLKEISKMTGGKYFRATSNKKLAAIYEEIDALEKSKIEVTAFKRYSELFYVFAMWAGILLVIEMMLRFTYFRSIS